MEYSMEIAFDLQKKSNVECTKTTITGLAQRYGASDFYCLHEIEGGTSIERNHCIIVVDFIEQQSQNIIKFLKDIKSMRHVYVECIYKDDGRYSLIHASPIYLRKLEKKVAQRHRKELKERFFLENEREMIRLIKNK